MKLKTYNIIVIGCQMNKADSERIAGFLEKQGMKPIQERKRADLAVVVSCGVRQSAESRIYGLIPRIKKDNPKTKILFTGCLVYRDDIREKMAKWIDWWMPINLISKFKIQNSNYNLQKEDKLQTANSALKIKIGDYLSLVPKYSSDFTAYVPIGNGCNNFCAYCVVPYARGREVYRPAEEIITEVKTLVKQGYKEIILIAQNVNSYKITNSKFQIPIKFQNPKSKNINFPLLLRIINDIPGDFWMRFATSHPKDMSDELIKTIVKCEKVCEHIHLPVQAGDDEVLKRMNRKYTVAHYKSLIEKIRKNYESRISNDESKVKSQKSKSNEASISITTDVIVGFPGETKTQFNHTVKLFKEIKFDLAYIACYSPRPGTAAAKMKDDVPKAEKRRREKELNDILSQTSLDNNKRLVGCDLDVLVNSKNDRGEFFGFTRTYKNVRISGDAGKIKIGDFIKVHIKKAKNFGLEGDLVK